MRVKGHVLKQILHILMDSGSTHNFLDLYTAKKLGCRFTSTCPLQVSVAGGTKLVSQYMVSGFQFSIHGVKFTTDVMLLPLGGCELVLGVQWLSTLETIQWNFKKLHMQFVYEGRKVVLRGTNQSELAWLEGKRLPKLLNQQSQISSMCCLGQTATLHLMKSDGNDASPMNEKLQELLKEFDDVFEIPKELPPHRNFDHQIPLKEENVTVNIRPYRYPPAQKDTIETMVKELLDSGVIRPSNSPFSSPIVMVKKKDGSWRMCIDYRHLNKHTVKDKFPIPVIEELIDELQGAQVFSKLDLRSGYHQVRMCEKDVYKTAFRSHEGHYEFVVMPFGLTNAPSTFQALMNSVFKPFLRRFTLVFFDDILVYSPSLVTHLAHLRMVLQVMRENTLFAKKSKCVFGTEQIEYLGHVISAQGVSTDSSKISAMKEWPTPTTLKQLRGFLGLTGYYRRFIKGYADISKPLTVLLKKNAFQWNSAAQQAFEHLKQAMVNSPVLALPNFDEEFVIETDASGFGVGAVLQQKGHPIAYLSKTLAPKHQSLSTYEKELLAVVLALQKWRGYLLDKHFKIRIDHFSLKYVLDQRITTPFQSKWLPKLLGFDYEIEYKKGSENVAADALSRIERQGQLFSILTGGASNELMDAVVATWTTDTTLKAVIEGLQAGTLSDSKYEWKNDQLRRKDKWVVGQDLELRKKLVAHFHNSAVGGHSGVQATTKRLTTYFYWKGLRKMVKEWVRNCDVCQRNKADLSAYPGLLQPLPIPEKIWQDISMDFVEALPMSQGKSALLVVVDRLSKYAHFLPIPHPFTATQVAQVFLDHVYKLHGLPKTIVSDRDKIFMSLFWQSLFKMLQVQLKYSSSYHPQTDGHTKIVNKCLETYLRCMTGEQPKDWVKWIPLAEYWYNTNYHSATNTTPYEIVYGQTPPLHIPYMAKDSAVDAVDRTLHAREQAIKMLQFNLKKAQDRMKSQADKQRSDRVFNVGDWVYLKLQPYRQLTIRQGKQNKLSSKFYGPFQVIQKIGKVAYKLELPDYALVHPVFHVSQLKPCHSEAAEMGRFPQCDADGLLAATPFKLLERKMVKKGNRLMVLGLIQWSNGTTDDATWEDLAAIVQRFPDFVLDP